MEVLWCAVQQSRVRKHTVYQTRRHTPLSQASLSERNSQQPLNISPDKSYFMLTSENKNKTHTHTKINETFKLQFDTADHYSPTVSPLLSSGFVPGFFS